MNLQNPTRNIPISVAPVGGIKKPPTLLSKEQETMMSLLVPRQVHLLITSRCNLKCIYCGISGKSVDSNTLFDMPSERLEKILRILTDHPSRHINLSGGEVTFHPNWYAIVNQIIDKGFTVSMFANFASLFTENDLSHLVKFKTITVSIDSADRTLNKILRPKVDLENIFFNILQLRQYSLLNRQKMPVIQVNCTMGDLNLRGLPSLIALVASAGLTQLSITDVTELENCDNGFKSILNFDAISRDECRLILDRCKGIALDSGVNLTIDNHIENVILNGNRPEVSPDMTRDCLDLWSLLHFNPNSNIHTCCVDYPPVAHVDEVENIRDIFLSSKNTRCKSELLTGELSAQCQKCVRKQIVPKNAFATEVLRFANG